MVKQTKTYLQKRCVMNKHQFGMRRWHICPKYSYISICMKRRYLSQQKEYKILQTCGNRNTKNMVRNRNLVNEYFIRYYHSFFSRYHFNCLCFTTFISRTKRLNNEQHEKLLSYCKIHSPIKRQYFAFENHVYPWFSNLEQNICLLIQTSIFLL